MSHSHRGRARARFAYLLAAACAALSCVRVAQSQEPTQLPPTPPTVTLPTPTAAGDTVAGQRWFDRLAIGDRLTGDIVLTGEGYTANGIEARRPGGTWRISMGPQLALIGGISVGVNVLVSSDQSSLRQNVSQLGINPTWRDLTLHLGDFTRGYSQYTTQGVRVRGGGFDFHPALFRLGFQAGRTQRAISSLQTGPVFRRSMLAGVIGVGRETGPSLDFSVVHAKDDINSVEQDLLVLDTLFDDPTIPDTIPEELRPRANTTTRPQENLVVGAVGRLPLFNRRLTIRGEMAGAAITHDLTAPAANREALDGVARLAAGVMPLRLSSAGDIAWNGEVALALGPGSLKVGYEYVGAGFTSLGLGYLINDRRAYTAGGTVRALADRVVLQGQYQHQNDNLLGQKTATTSRDAVTATVSTRLGTATNASVTGLINVIGNDAPIDTQVVDNRSTAITTTLSQGRPLFGRPSTISIAYGVQGSTDGNTVRAAPGVTVHNLSTSVQVALTPRISVAPTLSGVVTSVEAQESQRNVFAGLRGNGRFLRDRLRHSLGISRAYSSGRQTFAITTQTSYTMPWESRLSVSSRSTSYSAYGQRPAFRESFITTSVSRSF